MARETLEQIRSGFPSRANWMEFCFNIDTPCTRHQSLSVMNYGVLTTAYGYRVRKRAQLEQQWAELYHIMCHASMLQLEKVSDLPSFRKEAMLVSPSITISHTLMESSTCCHTFS